ncbi:hypothetical protein ACWD4O_18535 [Streptomyces sp. NPDC002623]
MTAYDASVRTEAWHWYSKDHARAATLFSRKCRELEETLETSSPDKEAEHRSYAAAAILASVAFMEASLNELLASADHENLGVGGALGGLPQDERQALTALKKAWGRSGPSTLDRLQLVLHLLRREPFKRGASPFQEAQLVVSLRNDLVHYPAEWRVGVGATEEEARKGLAAKLKGKFPENPFMPKQNPYFPDRCLGHGCTAWAWKSIFELMEKFFEQVGVTPIFDDVRGQLNP